MSARAQESTFRIEPMKRRHMREVLDIERSVYVRPWSAALFFSEISQRKSRYYIVALDGDELLGYAGLMVHDGDGHITNVAVRPASQGRLIGAQLCVSILEEAREREAHQITLEVRVANWPAQRLYSWFGFRPVGIRRNYYAETGEDALVMMLADCQDDETAHRLGQVRARIAANTPRPPTRGRRKPRA